jgi:hypothetical protein
MLLLDLRLIERETEPLSNRARETRQPIEGVDKPNQPPAVAPAFPAPYLFYAKTSISGLLRRRPSIGRSALVSVGDKIAELQDKGFCILKAHFAKSLIQHCRAAFWPTLLDYLERNQDKPNRGERRHFLAMPFTSPCFAPEFFFDAAILGMVRGVMDDRVVADQWGCDVPLQDSKHQQFHVDYQRPLFPEIPDLSLPTYMLAVSFGLIDILPAHGPIEIAPGTHRMPRDQALRSVENAEIETQLVTLESGDVLIRHPWALHRGTPNVTDTPRALVTIRYVRRWYADDSREVNTIPLAVWQSLTTEQQGIMRFPLAV